MKKYKIQKNDYNRSLITETTPYETPIIFSNSGIYDLLSGKDNSNIIKSTIIRKISDHKTKKTIPYHYKIKKDSLEYRRLALIHPSSQIAIRDFYQEYEYLMIHFCNQSPASIRSIKGVANSFYKKSSWENINKYKSGSVALKNEEKYSKYSPSFFSYKGFDRLYKFFNSKFYFNLEKKYSHLRTIDISKCFDSIYTHTIFWATKDKEYAKENIQYNNFSDTFDRVIRRGNYEETNGIPIGAEINRIFAEIILQKIDNNVISELSAIGFEFDKEYAFYRYVDDIYVFTNDEEASKKIYKIFSNELLSFNLHVNQSKSTITSRPFTTKKSITIYNASSKTNDFIDKFLEPKNFHSLTPKSIRSKWKLTKNYIESIKETCGLNDANYSDIAPYLISILNERIKKIVSIQKIDDESIKSDYYSAFNVLLDIIFFLYTVAPSVGASYRLCTSIILIYRFSKINLPEHQEKINAKIYSLTLDFLTTQLLNKEETKSKTFINLESINIILSIRDLGDDYLIPAELIEKLLLNSNQNSYFTVISCLYYFNEREIYKDTQNKIIDECISSLKNQKNIFDKSESIHLLLDLIYCPYVSAQKKEDLIKIIFDGQPKKIDLAQFIKNDKNDYAFTNWGEVDLLNSLERKELKQAY